MKRLNCKNFSFYKDFRVLWTLPGLLTSMFRKGYLTLKDSFIKISLQEIMSLIKFIDKSILENLMCQILLKYNLRPLLLTWFHWDLDMD